MSKTWQPHCKFGERSVLFFVSQWARRRQYATLVYFGNNGWAVFIMLLFVRGFACEGRSPPLNFDARCPIQRAIGTINRMPQLWL